MLICVRQRRLASLYNRLALLSHSLTFAHALYRIPRAFAHFSYICSQTKCQHRSFSTRVSRALIKFDFRQNSPRREVCRYVCVYTTTDIYIYIYIQVYVKCKTRVAGVYYRSFVLEWIHWERSVYSWTREAMNFRWVVSMNSYARALCWMETIGRVCVARFYTRSIRHSLSLSLSRFTIHSCAEAFSLFVMLRALRVIPLGRWDPLYLSLSFSVANNRSGKREEKKIKAFGRNVKDVSVKSFKRFESFIIQMQKLSVICRESSRAFFCLLVYIYIYIVTMTIAMCN